MPSIRPCPLPDAALLGRYVEDGAYTDCYAADVAGEVTLARFVTAFYTTPVFKLERWILKWAVSKPSTDGEAAQLGAGAIDRYAAWRVEQRGEDQLLLGDFLGRTKSWLMVMPLESSNGAITRLYFGSAVVPVRDPRTGAATIGRSYRALLGFHKRYSVMLLSAACARLKRMPG